MNRELLLQLLSQHRPINEEETGHVTSAREFVVSTDEFASRFNPAGHLTGSAWVVNPTGDAVLLIHHVNLDRWLQPGGHVEEGDATIHVTAQREAMEECGIDAVELVDTQLYHIDVHSIPERKGFPSHLHYDVRFLVKVSEDSSLRAQAEEIHSVKWFRPAEILTKQLGPSIDSDDPQTSHLVERLIPGRIGTLGAPILTANNQLNCKGRRNGVGCRMKRQRGTGYS